MRKADTTHLGHNAKGDSRVNGNDEPPVNAVPFTDLASGMQMSEDALLQRLAAILCKKENDADVTAAEK